MLGSQAVPVPVQVQVQAQVQAQALHRLSNVQTWGRQNGFPESPAYVAGSGMPLGLNKADRLKG